MPVLLRASSRGGLSTAAGRLGVPGLLLALAACEPASASSATQEQPVQERLESIPVAPRHRLAATEADSSPSAPARARDCPVFRSGRAGGRIASPELDELSGLVASRKNAGVLWVHNDSGDRPRVFAIRPDGALLGRFTLPIGSAVDWEDIAIGPGPRGPTPHLYIGDIGDNGRSREEGLLVHRVAEPAIFNREGTVERELKPVETFRLRYPDRRHDAETLLVEPKTGEVVLLTKALLRTPRVFYVDALKKPLMTLQGGERIDLAASGISMLLPTAGDVSADGRWVIVRSYTVAYLWKRDPGRPLHETFSTPACSVPLAREPQGESLGFSADGKGYYTVSEKPHQPVFHYALAAESPEPSAGPSVR